MGIFSRVKTTILGEGVSGKVELCWKNQKCYAVKTYHSKESYESRKEYHTRVLSEYHVLLNLHHDNFIKVIKYTVLLDGLTVKMYMEAGTQDLAKLLRAASQVDSAEILCIWKQLCAGVHYLHSLGLCHRDLKLENLVLDRNSNTLKIVDLATVCECSNGKKAVGIVGSKSYMAPETYLAISYDGQSADIWSMAIILYYLTNRKFPWVSAEWNDEKYARFVLASQVSEKNQKVETTRELQNTSMDNEVFDMLPEESADLVSHMLEIEPVMRYCLEDTMKNKWLMLVSYCAGGRQCGHVHILH